jgi:2'-5' RNA ligase
MMRLFLGLELPNATRERLSALPAPDLPSARWVPPENYHVTLRFLGETPRYLAADIDDAVSRLHARPFTVALAGLGTFARGGIAHTLWVGVDRNEALERLRGKIETTLQRLGLEPERRRFQPHVTLARLDQTPEFKLAGFIAAHNLFRAEPFVVEHFTLFSSVLGKDHAVYTPEVQYSLTPEMG